MSMRLQRLLGNLCLAAMAMAVTFAFLEFVVFGAILKPDDVLERVTIGGVVRYEPGTRAFRRLANGSRTTVNINADGWHSSKPVYRVAREPGRARVAVIGDAYVHGGLVETAEGFPEVLERTLVAGGRDAEVYRFGMEGAKLGQYLHMLRHEVLPYKPDVVVVQLVHDDFDTSDRRSKTRHASSFPRLATDAQGRVVEVPSVPFAPGVVDVLRTSGTFRYLHRETNLYLEAKNPINGSRRGAEPATEVVGSAVDVHEIADRARHRVHADYVMREMQALSARHGFKLAFVMDGVRAAVYAGADAFAAGRLNAIAAELSTEHNLPFLDLQRTFAAHFAVHHQRFEFDFDWHWNPLGNRLAGEAIARLLLADPRLLGAPRPVGEAAAGGPPGWANRGQSSVGRS